MSDVDQGDFSVHRNLLYHTRKGSLCLWGAGEERGREQVKGAQACAGSWCHWKEHIHSFNMFPEGLSRCQGLCWAKGPRMNERCHCPFWPIPWLLVHAALSSGWQGSSFPPCGLLLWGSLAGPGREAFRCCPPTPGKGGVERTQGQ